MELQLQRLNYVCSLSSLFSKSDFAAPESKVFFLSRSSRNINGNTEDTPITREGMTKVMMKDLFPRIISMLVG